MARDDGLADGWRPLTRVERARQSDRMGSRDKLRPTPPPPGPALVWPAIGVLLLALGGVAEVGCTKRVHGDPPMPPPMPDPRYDDPPPMPPRIPARREPARVNEAVWRAGRD